MTLKTFLGRGTEECWRFGREQSLMSHAFTWHWRKSIYTAIAAVGTGVYEHIVLRNGTLVSASAT